MVLLMSKVKWDRPALGYQPSPERTRALNKGFT